MRISVIVPVYNTRHEYLNACLDSLLTQGFSDYEVIVVNDGSTNGCEKVIEKKLSENDNLVYINQENGGTSVARNTGLSATKGDYILFVDADDYVSEDCLKTVYEAMSERQTDILLFGYATNYTNREVRRVLDEPDPSLWERDTLELAVLQGNPGLGPVEVGAPWGKLIKADIIRENNLQYTRGLIKGQDTVFMLSLFEHCGSFSYLPYLGYHYRISNVSVSHRYNPEIIEIMEKTLSAYSDFVERYQKDPKFSEAVRKKYYKVMLGEYLELFFLHKENKATEKEKEEGFKRLIERSPYSDAIEDADPGGAGFYQRILIRSLKEKKIGMLFMLKRLELFLRNQVVRKYV